MRQFNALSIIKSSSQLKLVLNLALHLVFTLLLPLALLPLFSFILALLPTFSVRHVSQCPSVHTALYLSIHA